jgi:type IV secretory pathway VirB9-like protein
MTATIITETRWDHLALVMAERERRGMWRPAPFRFPAQAMSARRAETAKLAQGDKEFRHG